MSGGHYENTPFQLRWLAEEIETELRNDFKIEEDCGSYDYLVEVPPEDKAKFIQEIEDMVKDMKRLSAKLRSFDYFMSGDYGYNSLKEEWKNDDKND